MSNWFFMFYFTLNLRGEATMEVVGQVIMQRFGENKSSNMIIYSGTIFVMSLFIMIIFLNNVTSYVLSFFVTLWVLVAHYFYLQQKHNACNILNLSSIQKCIFSIRKLTYGGIVDVCNGYCKLKKQTIMETLNFLERTIKQCFELNYL